LLQGHQPEIMILHIAKRIAFVVLGYLAAIVTGCIAFPLLLMVISKLLPESGVWTLLGLSPVFLLILPVAFAFFLWFALYSTVIQAVLAAVATEALALRRVGFHIPLAIAIMLSAVVVLHPQWFLDVSFTRVLITLAAALAAALAGLVNWAIAGRNAGWQPPP
jgi:hypothetical protein